MVPAQWTAELGATHPGSAQPYPARDGYDPADDHRSTPGQVPPTAAAFVPAQRWPGADPTILLPYTPSSVAGARRVLSTDLRERGISEEVISDAILVLSEMLSNTLKHASPLPESGRVRMGWTVEGVEPDQVQPNPDGPEAGVPRVATVYLMVNDGGGTTRPRVLSVTQSATGGRGLSIVTSLADEWGIDEVSNPGTTMWVRFYDGLPGSRSERALRRAHAQAHPHDHS